MPKFKVGDRVERNPLKWVNGNLDRGRGNPGTVTRVYGISGVSVKWDRGMEYSGFDESELKFHITMPRREKVEEEQKFASALLELKRRNLAIYEKMEYSDFSIICQADDGRQFRFSCHKAIVAAGSGHFARMFETGSEMIEVSQGEVRIEGYNEEVVEAFIKSLYISEVDRKVLEENAAFILKMADQYDVPKLKEEAADFMRASMSVENVLDTLLAAYSYNAPVLQSAAIKFVVEHKLDGDFIDDWRVVSKDLLFEIFKAFNEIA